MIKGLEPFAVKRVIGHVGHALAAKGVLAAQHPVSTATNMEIGEAASGRTASTRARGIRRYGALAVLFAILLAAMSLTHVVPARALGPPPGKPVAAGGGHTIAVTSNRTVLAWGLNGNGQLGDGTTTDKSSPVQVLERSGSGLSTLAFIVAVSAGNSHSLALDQNGAVWAWGSNTYGELGDGTTVQRSAAVPVIGPDGLPLGGVVSISAGFSHSLAVKADGSVWAWGRNNSGQLGNGTTTDTSIPVQVAGSGGTGHFVNASTVSAGDYFSLARTLDGAVWAWGLNDKGQLGNGSASATGCACVTTPGQVTGTGGGIQGSTSPTYITAISAGANPQSHAAQHRRGLGLGRQQQLPAR
jgi:hypothetical protein